MAKTRTSIFDDEDGFDVSAFAPKGEGRTVAPNEVKAVSEALRFKSREAPATDARHAAPRATQERSPLPAEVKPVDRQRGNEPQNPLPRRAPRRHRTGRTAQLNVRTSPKTLDAVYAIADANGWLVGETVERAVEALRRELAMGQD